MDLEPHLLFLRWKITTLKREKWIVFECVVVHPFAKVVGDIKPTKVVTAKFIVDDNDGLIDALTVVVLVVVSDQNVAFLEVVVAEHKWRVHSFDSISAKTNLKNNRKSI